MFLELLLFRDIQVNRVFVLNQMEAELREKSINNLDFDGKPVGHMLIYVLPGGCCIHFL